MDKEAGILFSYGRYVVIAIDNHLNENGKVCDAYGLYNTETDIMELEHTMLWHVMQWAIKCEHAVRDLSVKTLEENQKILSWPEAVEAAESENNKPKKPN